MAQDIHGGYWAIGCKVYQEREPLYADDIACFLATSSKMFSDPFSNPQMDPQAGKQMSFSNRLYIATTSHITADIECLVQNQQPPFTIITRADLESSPVERPKGLAKALL